MSGLPFNPFQFTPWQDRGFRPSVGDVRKLIVAFQKYEELFREVDRQRAAVEAENDVLRDQVQLARERCRCGQIKGTLE